MPDEPPRRHVLRFVGVTLALSLILYAPLLLVGWQSSSAFVVGLSSLLGAAVPAWSMIAAAVGAPWSRKPRYMLALLAFVLAFDLLAFMTGWQQLAMSAAVVDSVRSEVLVALYQMALVSAPVVTLVLFAGKRPSVFWTSEQPT